MGEIATFRSEDRVGLIAAIVLHLALVAALAIQVNFAPPVRDMAERMTVSLASEVGLEAASPNPAEESRVAVAPTMNEELGAEAEPVVEDVSEAPAPTQPTFPRRTAVRSDNPRTPETRPTPRASPSPAQVAKAGGGSRIGDDFLSGKGSSSESDNTNAPATQFGRTERAALASAITRQLRDHWSAPQGADAEKLVSVIAWELNPDGSLKGRPRLVEQRGVTPSNRPQASIHAERAMRAVQRAAPFNLPEQFYSRWDELEWVFDRRL